MDQGTASPKENFSLGHIGVIALTAAALTVFTVVRGGPQLFAKKPQAPTAASYDQSKAQVAALQAAQQPGADNTMSQQLALIDPEHFGSVLGTSTAQNVFPDIGTLVTPQQLNQIHVNMTDKSDKDAISAYSDELAYVEASNNIVGIFQDMNSGDAGQQATAKRNSQYMVKELSMMDVPQPLVTYQRYKMMYYDTLSLLADYFANKKMSTSLDDLTASLFSLSEGMGNIEAQILSEYGVKI